MDTRVRRGSRRMTNLDQVFEFLVFDAHIVDGVEEGDSIGESSMDLQYALPHCFPSRFWSQILAKDDSELAYGADC